jgi:hypothetical protein
LFAFVNNRVVNRAQRLWMRRPITAQWSDDAKKGQERAAEVKAGAKADASKAEADAKAKADKMKGDASAAPGKAKDHAKAKADQATTDAAAKANAAAGDATAKTKGKVDAAMPGMDMGAGAEVDAGSELK